MSDAVTLSTESRGIARITISRPDRKNAFDAAVIAELTAAVGRVDRSARAVVLQSEGDTFCAGADVEWMRGMAGYSLDENIADSKALAAMFRALYDLEMPLLARVQGAALGGQNVRGAALVKAELRLDPAATHLTLDASAALHVGTEIWSGVVGDSATLQLSGALTDRTITLEDMKFTGRAASFAASGELTRPAPDSRSPSPSVVHTRWNLEVQDLKALSPTLAGTLGASGKMDGPLTAFAGEVQLTSTLSVG